MPSSWLALFVTEPAALYKKLVTNDAKILMPYTADGGEYRVADPDGHVLRVFSGAPDQ
jgi:hypothetical protein